jgi:hypothetical protein
MEPLAFAKSWIADLHRIGCPVAEVTEREIERVVALAAEAGLPDGATIALIRDILRRTMPVRPGRRASIGSIGADLEGVGVVHVDGGGFGDGARP